MGPNQEQMVRQLEVSAHFEEEVSRIQVIAVDSKVLVAQQARHRME